MSAALDATVIRFRADKEDVAACTVAYCDRPSGTRRLFLRDTAERMWVADMAASGTAVIVDGPVSVEQALEAAERVALGLDHGAVTRTMMTLAVGLIGLMTTAAPPPNLARNAPENAP